MSLFKLNDPTPISASVLEALVTSGGLVPGPGTNNLQIQIPTSVSTALGLSASVYAGNIPSGVGSGIAAAINTLIAIPFISSITGIINQGIFNVTVVGTAGSVARVGMYDAVNNNLPTNLLADGGSVATDAGTGQKLSTFNNVAVKAGQLYYLAYLCGVAAPTITCASAPTAYFGNAASNLNAQTGFFVSFAFGALPSIFPLAGIGFSTNATTPTIWVRFA